jgi:DNA (cytosine-5)-methyltransferase 1
MKTDTTHVGILKSVYADAFAKESFTGEISPSTKNSIDHIIESSENSKGVFTVAVTSIVQKIYDPSQDVRLHQRQIPGGYSGRTIDTAYITPFLKDKGFPAMVESGWLTRSLEQPHPYDESYPGKIRQPKLRLAFLDLFAALEVRNESPRELLTYIFIELIREAKANHVPVVRHLGDEVWLSRDSLIQMFNNHFQHPFGGIHGASRLPVLAIYACLEQVAPALLSEQGLILQPLGNHNSADARSGSFGDIEFCNSDNQIKSVIEVKFEIQIGREILRTCARKALDGELIQLQVVSTAKPLADPVSVLEQECSKLFLENGCDLQYFDFESYVSVLLGFVRSPEDVMNSYAQLLEKDGVVKREHKLAWNQICESRNN